MISKNSTHDRAFTLTAPADNRADHGSGRPGKADSQKNAAQIENENIRGKGICKLGRNEANKSCRNQFLCAETSDQSTKENVDQRGCDKAQAIVDGKKPSVNSKRLGDRSDIKTFG